MQILVLGMHRSGTSAVSNLLANAGIYFGSYEQLVEKNEDNEKGFWERKDVLEFNNTLLRSNGFDWFKINNYRGIESLTEESRKKYLQKITPILQEMEKSSPWAVKDPRMCLLRELWESHLTSPLYILVFRNPIEVALSLQERNSFPIEFSLKLWHRYYLFALRGLKGKPVLFVNYNTLMEDPQTTTQIILRFLTKHGVPIDQEILSEVAGNIDRKLYRQRADNQITGVAEEIEILFEQLDQGEIPFDLTIHDDLSLLKYEAAFDKIMNFNGIRNKNLVLEKSNGEKDQMIRELNSKLKESRNDHREQVRQSEKMRTELDSSTEVIGRLKVEQSMLTDEIARKKRQLSKQSEQIEKLNRLNKEKEDQLIIYWNKIQEMRLSSRLKSLFKFPAIPLFKNKKQKTVKVLKPGRTRPASPGRDLDFSPISRINTKLRITVITPSTNIHGGVKRLLMISNLLTMRGHHVKVVRQYPGRDLDWFDLKAPIIDLFFDEDTEPDFLEEKFPNGDILITYGNCKANGILAQLPAKKGLKFALFMHFAIHDLELDVRNAALDQFKLLCTTSWIAQEIAKHSGREASVIDFGVHTDQFYRVPSEKKRFIIGALYHKDQWKRSIDVIEAYLLLREKYDLQLIMFGQVKNPDLPHGVVYHYDPDQQLLRELYSSCSVWVTPSLFEGIGMCSIEAMLCETVLITVDTGGSRDYCTEENSYIVEKKSPEAIAEAVAAIIAQPEIARIKAEKALQDIHKHSWSNCIELIEKRMIDEIDATNPAGYRSLNYELTVGIPIHNELEYVKNCIESLRRNTHHRYQLILIDDVSDRDTREYLSGLTGDNIKYIKNFERRGFPYNCNEIIRHANGKYICLLNSDTVTTKNWDLFLIEALKENTKLGMGGPSTSYGVAKNYQSIAQQMEKVHFKRFEMSVEDMETFANELQKNKSVELTEYLNGFCMLFDRSIVSEIGFFDESFGLGSREEVQYVDRLRMQGYEVAWVRHCYVHHYGHRSFTKYEDSASLWEKNKELYHRTKGKQLKIGIPSKKVGYIYASKFASATRKRTFEVHKYLNEYADIKAIHWNEVETEFIRRCDIIVVQRIGGLNEIIPEEFVQSLLRWMKIFDEKEFFYDIDDLIVHSQGDLPIRLMRSCTGIIASTNTLAMEVSEYNNNVIVLPNGVDYERFLKTCEERTPVDHVVIVCFSLAGAGVEFLNELGDNLRSNSIKNTLTLFTGESIEQDLFPNVQIKKNVGLDELFRALNHADYLINWGGHSDSYFQKLEKEYDLKPAQKEAFVRSKSGLKYYNAAISKTIILSTEEPRSYLELIREEETGFIISTSEQAINIITKLENDKPLKQSILQNAFQHTLTMYSMNAVARQYLEFFNGERKYLLKPSKNTADLQ